MTPGDSHSETAFGITAVVATAGLLTLGLFPLALPILLLTGLAIVPLALPAIVAALAFATFAGLRAAVRAAVRRGGRLRRAEPQGGHFRAGDGRFCSPAGARHL